MRNDKEYSRPFGPDGPRIRVIPESELPKEDSELSYHGLRILRNTPAKKGRSVGVRTLAEELNALGDYGGFTGMVNELVERGYLKMDKKTSQLRLTKKGKDERKDLESFE